MKSEVLQLRIVSLIFDWLQQVMGKAPDIFCRLMESKWIPPILRWTTTYTRDIDFLLSRDEYGDTVNSSEENNDILQRAILLYLSHLSTQYSCGGVKVQLVPNGKENLGSLSERMENLSLKLRPPDDTWIEIGKSLHLLYSESEKKYRDDSDDSNHGGAGTASRSESTTITIRASLPTLRDGKVAVDSFVEDAFSWYKAMMKSQDPGFRYMYHLSAEAFKSLNDGDSKAQSAELLYRRYPLSDTKKFSSLFFPEKHRVMTLLNDLVNKQGKFSVKGFPQKLGLLLHGPPGTGKTSLIKAIAERTSRHIVSIPLARIQTNQQLMDIMFSGRFKTGKREIHRHPFDKIIFVLEDVDCAGEVVLKRRAPPVIPSPSVVAKKESATIGENKGGGLQDDDDATCSTDGSTTSCCTASALSNEDEVEDGGNPADDSSSCRLSSQGSFMVDNEEQEEGGKCKDDGHDSDSDGDGDDDKGGEQEALSEEDKSRRDIAEYIKQLEQQQDVLNLSGLLNVLDGVVDCPGRIVIMTSNRPEMLDPALVRPGRVNFRLHMGYIRPKAAVQMVEHYFQRGLKVEEIAELREILGCGGEGDIDCWDDNDEDEDEEGDEEVDEEGGKPIHHLTPAELEQMCVECCSVSNLFQKLRSFIHS